MVDYSVTIAACTGVLLTAVFILWEVGHYATPQVSVNRFDERREIFAYTVGLFVGVLLVIPWLYFEIAFTNADLIGVFVFLLIVVGVTELAQWGIRRTRYWGEGTSFPFYAIGLRCGIGALLITGLVAEYLTTPSITAGGIAVVALQSCALLMLEAASALISIPTTAGSGQPSGGSFSSAVLLFVGLFLLGFNAFAGEVVGAAAALIALGGAVYVYSNRRPILDRIRPPAPAGRPAAIPSRYARTDREEQGPKSP